MAVLPTDYTDATTPTGATTDLPATTSRGLNAITTQINTNTTDLAAKGQLAPVRLCDRGSETYTISSGSVTQIAGTTIDAVSVAVGNRVLIQGAPAATGVGGGYGTNQPANGVYKVDAVAANISLSRTSDMSGTVNPAGLNLWVMEGVFNAGAAFNVTTPTNPSAAFTWGTTSIQWTNPIVTVASGQTITGQKTFVAPNLGTPASGTLTNCTGLPSTGITGLTSGNTSQQSQATVAGTAYYITGSNLTVPTNLAVGSRFRWTVAMAKTNVGTGTFQIRIYRGTNGTTADTADVTQTIGTQTAVVDSMVVDVELVVTTTGATGAYYWTVIPMNRASTTTAAGFGVAYGATGQFSGTVSSVALNTASLKFGLSFIANTGGTLPTITVPLVRSQAYV